MVMKSKRGLFESTSLSVHLPKIRLSNFYSLRFLHRTQCPLSVHYLHLSGQEKRTDFSDGNCAQITSWLPCYRLFLFVKLLRKTSKSKIKLASFIKTILNSNLNYL